jgi:hypothetical protein
LSRHTIAAVLQRGNQARFHPGFVELALHRAVGVQPLADFEAILAAHRRRGLGIEEIVDVAPVVALHEQQVAKA